MEYDQITNAKIDILVCFMRDWASDLTFIYLFINMFVAIILS